MNELELYHHGVKGMKWGVRKEKTINSINRMYDKANRYATKQADRFRAKNNHAKASVMDELVRRNNKARLDKTKAISKMTEEEFKEARRNEFRKSMRDGYEWAERNAAAMTLGISRFSERDMQTGLNWTLKRMNEKGLSTIPASKRFDYVHNEYIERKADRIRRARNAAMYYHYYGSRSR